MAYFYKLLSFYHRLQIPYAYYICKLSKILDIYQVFSSNPTKLAKCFQWMIDIEKAIDYLKTLYLPTGYDEAKLIYEVNRSYGKNADMFGMKRGDYKPYSEYKKSKTN